MKTFFFTTLFRFVVFAGGWIYLSGFQSELLYNTLGAMNPATQAVNTCMSGVDSISSGLNAKLDMILMKVDGNTTTNSGAISPTTLTIPTIDATTGSAIKIIDNSANS